MVEHQPTIVCFTLLAGQEAVVGDVQCGEPLFTEVIASGAFRCQDEDNIVVGRVHAVEVPKVQVGVWVEQGVCLDLESVAAVGGVLWGFACVELCITAEEDSLQFAADGRAVTATVVLH